MSALALAALGAHAQSLPPGVAACASETDVLKRLSCFDREVAPYLSRPRPTANADGPVAAPATPTASKAATAAVVASAVAAPAAAAAGNAPRAAPRITAIDNYPGGIVLHLDNGQVWQEDEDTPVDLGLRVGDSVTPERVVGAWWVSGRNGASAKVRLKP